MGKANRLEISDRFFCWWVMSDSRIVLCPSLSFFCVDLCTADVHYVGAFILRIYVNFRQPPKWQWGRRRHTYQYVYCSYAKLFIFIWFVFTYILYFVCFESAIVSSVRLLFALLLLLNYISFRFLFHFAQHLAQNGWSKLFLFIKTITTTFNVRPLCWCVHKTLPRSLHIQSHLCFGSTFDRCWWVKSSAATRFHSIRSV